MSIIMFLSFKTSVAVHWSFLFDTFLLFLCFAYPFCWTLKYKKPWLTHLLNFYSSVQILFKLNNWNCYFLRHTIDASIYLEPFCLSNNSAFINAQIQLISPELKCFLSLSKVWWKNHILGFRCPYARVKEWSSHIDSHLGKYQITQRWSESVLRSWEFWKLTL